jgi:hypothetical protein
MLLSDIVVPASELRDLVQDVVLCGQTVAWHGKATTAAKQPPKLAAERKPEPRSEQAAKLLPQPRLHVDGCGRTNAPTLEQGGEHLLDNLLLHSLLGVGK